MSNSNQAPAFFAVIPAPVLNDEKLSDAAKILYARVSSLAQQDGYCWASNEALAKIARCGVRTISRLLSLLQECGHIKIKIISAATRKGGRERRIFIGKQFIEETSPDDDPDEQTPDDQPSVSEAPNAENLENSSIDKNGEGRQKCPDQSRQKCLDPNIMYLQVKSISTPPTPPECLARISEYAAEDKELEAGILDLVANRAEALGQKKAVKTLRTLNGILRDLDRYSGGNRTHKLRMLENAVKNNWLTVYPLRQDDLRAPQQRSTRVREEENVRFV